MYRCLPKLAVWLKDCAMFAGEDRDWAMCHVGEKYQHLSLCSKGFRSLKETLVRLIIRSFSVRPPLRCGSSADASGAIVARWTRSSLPGFNIRVL